MKIVIKLPTRNRTSILFPLLDLYYSFLSNRHEVEFMINCDQNDFSMRSQSSIRKLGTYKNLTCYFEPNKTKIEAINANLNSLPSDFDILVLTSDDMTPVAEGYDDIIAQAMLDYHPNMDGALWFNDGLWANQLNTLPIMGKKYFQRFGYIYHPGYKSFYADNEYTEVGKKLGKIHYIDKLIIRHDHCTASRERKRDELYWANEKYWREDEILHVTRASNGFP